VCVKFGVNSTFNRGRNLRQKVHLTIPSTHPATRKSECAQLTPGHELHELWVDEPWYCPAGHALIPEEYDGQ
jgi:hypothetical protein